MNRLIFLPIALLFIFASILAQNTVHSQNDLSPRAYLPLAFSPTGCPGISINTYSSGMVFQFDTDNPVRPAYNHADKNLDLRGYTLNSNTNLQRELVDYGSDDPTQPPQLATLFIPNQVPPFAEFYQVGQWAWASSPEPGQRVEPITTPKVTALSFGLDSGTTLYAPSSGYDIGGGMEVIVLYADENSLSLHYTREDSAARGYTIHIDQICTDPNLLSLYNSLDDANGPRYVFPSGGYNLPTLPAGQIFGVTGNNDMVIAIADTGTYQDPRSCNEWWQIRPGYNGSCPPQQ